MNAVTNDGTDSTIYSDPIMVPRGETLAMHLESDETVATYASAITLWASNKPTPSLTDDTDWVQMVAGHGWGGFPVLTGGDFTGGDEKDFTDIGVSGALWYRLKFVRTTGTGLISLWVTRKDLK
jgi:hypothetical protein